MHQMTCRGIRAARAALVTGIAAIALVTRAEPLTSTQRIELPGVEGRIDHFAIDRATDTLFVAALGADTVEVIDLRARKRMSRIAADGEPQGAAFDPQRKRLFVANGEAATVQVIENGRVVHAIKNLPDADNLRLDGDKLFAGFGHGIAVIDAGTLAVVQRIALPGHPEAFEVGDARIYVNVPESKAVVVIDRGTGKEEARWGLEPLAGNFPMALDSKGGRLFLVTRRPPALLALDARSGKQRQRLGLCGDADDLFFDRQRQRVYAICGQGEVDVVDARADAGLRIVQRVATSAGARTGLFVPESGELFVAAPRRRGPAAVLVFRIEQGETR